MPHPARTRPSGAPPRAFTLLEMLVVIAIVITLSGLLLTALSAARVRSKAQRTEALMILVESAIDSYQQDFQDYPHSEGADAVVGCENLLKALTTDEKGGPYLKSKDMATCDENHNGVPEIADAFNHAFRYLHHKDYQNKSPNRRTYRLYSMGPDGAEDMFNPASDDIVNWKKGAPEEE